eukprot:TRINITY_DN3251_c0_g1_i1.p2 TRINITY_DN3251_c0_g1~~TRINITY_DN3251_c0_g1_i1.p2  ORF type:complete len:286 (-),score=36.41 TRINITY_DN3251_c0_g1_i1:2726-3487(-)
MDRPVCVAHVVEHLKENFGLNVRGEPFLAHINLSNNKGSLSSNQFQIVDLRFNINALKHDKGQAIKKIEELKAGVEENPHLEWDHKWESEATNLFLDQYRKKLSTIEITPLRNSEPISGKNRLAINTSSKNYCKALDKWGFKWLKDVRGDYNCYYRAVMCGYLETLLSGEPDLIKEFIKMLKVPEGEVFSLAEPEEKEAVKKMVPVLQRLANAREKLGIQKALQEFFLDSIASDDLMLVILKEIRLICRAVYY